MEEQSLFKLEIGCGKTKTNGYIGIDRFPLPGVDIVADLNKAFPIEDDKVDVVYACHSLEHFDNLEFTIDEIFRIGKHKCIVQVLAPYSYTTLNTANFYHKNAFNEDTFRFFTTVEDTEVIDKEEWYTPTSGKWGLSESDNSIHSTQLELLNMEFFYYKEYLNFTDDKKRRARRSFNNVCDNIYYELVINKSGVPFTKEEINEIKEKAKQLEPPIIQIFRNRDSVPNEAISVYDDINEEIKFKINGLEKSFNQDSKNKQQQINNIISEYERKFKLQSSSIELQSKSIDLLQKKVEHMQAENDKNSAIILDLYKAQENTIKSRLKLFRNNGDILESLQFNHRKFIDGIILNCNKFKKHSLLKLSRIVPYDNYFEYEIDGAGNTINFFTVSSFDAVLFVEIVNNGVIIKQENLTILNDGTQKIRLDGNIEGKTLVRFKTIDNRSFVKILEIINRKRLIFSRIDFASFISFES